MKFILSLILELLLKGEFNMLSWILLIVMVGAMTGLMLYSFGIVIFSKKRYDDPKKSDNGKMHSTTEKMRSKFVGRA